MRSRLEEILAAAATLLEQLEIPFALVGGLAVSVRGEARFTRDVDLAIAVAEDRQAEGIVSAFLQRGYGVQALVEQTEAGRMATIRLLPPGEPEEGVVLDLLFASSGIEPEIVAAAEPIEVFSRLTVPVAAPGHLMATKVLSKSEDRPQDWIDLLGLRKKASPAETARCQEALEQIEERGFARDKNLAEEWARLERRGSSG